MALGYSVTTRNGKANAITTAVGSAGVLYIYAGTRPATGGAAGTLLATFTLGSPFAPAAALGVLSPTLPSAVTASAGGTASWFRVATTSGATQVIDGDVGTSGSDLNLSTTTITTGLNISITSWTITMGNL